MDNNNKINRNYNAQDAVNLATQNYQTTESNKKKHAIEQSNVKTDHNIGDILVGSNKGHHGDINALMQVKQAHSLGQPTLATLPQPQSASGYKGSYTQTLQHIQWASKAGLLMPQETGLENTQSKKTAIEPTSETLEGLGPDGKGGQTNNSQLKAAGGTSPQNSIATPHQKHEQHVAHEKQVFHQKEATHEAHETHLRHEEHLSREEHQQRTGVSYAYTGNIIGLIALLQGKEMQTMLSILSAQGMNNAKAATNIFASGQAMAQAQLQQGQDQSKETSSNAQADQKTNQTGLGMDIGFITMTIALSFIPEGDAPLAAGEDSLKAAVPKAESNVNEDGEVLAKGEEKPDILEMSEIKSEETPEADPNNPTSAEGEVKTMERNQERVTNKNISKAIKGKSKFSKQIDEWKNSPTSKTARFFGGVLRNLYDNPGTVILKGFKNAFGNPQMSSQLSQHISGMQGVQDHMSAATAAANVGQDQAKYTAYQSAQSMDSAYADANKTAQGITSSVVDKATTFLSDFAKAYYQGVSSLWQ